MQDRNRRLGNGVNRDDGGRGNGGVRNIQEMRDRLDIYDNLLDEIEHYQVETDSLVNNIRYIDGLLR